MFRENRIKLIISIVSSLLMIVGITYAAWSFVSDNTDIVMTVDGDYINYNAGSDIIFSDILPVYDMYSDKNVVSKEINVYKESDDTTTGIDLYLDLKSWNTTLSSSSLRWALYKNDDYLSSGDFYGAKNGDTIKLTNGTQSINLESDKYKLYIWLDAYQESSASMRGKSVTVTLYGKVTFYNEDDIIPQNNTPNAPELVSGMIPVKYNSSIDEWVVADSANTNNDWYDYDDKIWANAVMVSSGVRDSYMSADLGTTVKEDDILAYYVWIPRYRYILFNTEFNSISPVEILIEFESADTESSNGTSNGEYLTHPAFTWDGEPIDGFWVGKFETTGTATKPLITPNLQALMNKSVSSFFNIIRLFGSTTYLSDTGVSVSDSHMIKNIEWGAVAYLSHSRYGQNSEVKINSGYITGRRGNNFTYNDFIISNNMITTTKDAGAGVLASTTGNVYGVYDTAGCRNEYVMAFMKNEDGTKFYQNSLFTDDTIPDEKYYDLYEYGDTSDDYSRSKLGDAMGETNGWYDGVKNFINFSNGWIVRWGVSSSGSKAGLFAFKNFSGTNHSGYSTRAVLLVP